MKGMSNAVIRGMFKIDKLNTTIDRRKVKGVYNTDDNKVNNHLVQVASDGSRTWSF
jgi:hypothetical protein